MADEGVRHLRLAWRLLAVPVGRDVVAGGAEAGVGVGGGRRGGGAAEGAVGADLVAGRGAGRPVAIPGGDDAVPAVVAVARVGVHGPVAVGVAEERGAV